MKDESKLDEELTSKTIRPTDKIKVARVIANMLDVDSAESMTPETAINTGLRKIKNKRMTPELIKVLRKMLNLAQTVGVKVDMSLLPAAMKEEMEQLEEMDKVTPVGARNMAGDILRLKDYIEMQKYVKAEADNKVGSKLHPDDDNVEDRDDQIRRMKVKHKTEDVYSADYKASPETGRKYRAHKINFANSGKKDKLQPENEEVDIEEAQVMYNTDAAAKAKNKAQLTLRHAKEREALTSRHQMQKKAMSTEEIESIDEESEELGHNDYEVLNLSDEDMDLIIASVDFDDLVDVADEDDVVVIDPETGEEIEDEDPVNEEALMEVLSRSERMKARIRFMRTKSKRQRRMQIAMKRRADPKTLNRRARRLAIKMLKQRLMKKPVSKLSVAEKERAEKIIKQRAQLINRLALRLVPKIRKMETDRLAGKKAAPVTGVAA